jgi:hypothetical protein
MKLVLGRAQTIETLGIQDIKRRYSDSVHGNVQSLELVNHVTGDRASGYLQKGCKSAKIQVLKPLHIQEHAVPGREY